MKKLLIAAFAIAAIVSCKKTVIESPSDEDFGYLGFNLSSDVEMSVVTKAEQTPEQTPEPEAAPAEEHSETENSVE